MKEKIYHLGIKALIEDEKGHILLLKMNQKKPKKALPMGCWDLPGGRVVEGETLEETLRREIGEETGITALKILDSLDTFLSPIETPLRNGKKAGLILTVYRCGLETPTPVRLSPEHTEFNWFPLQQGLALLLHKYPKLFIDKALSLPPPETLETQTAMAS